jgi:hypothetical protein
MRPISTKMLNKELTHSTVNKTFDASNTPDTKARIVRKKTDTLLHQPYADPSPMREIEKIASPKVGEVEVKTQPPKEMKITHVELPRSSTHLMAFRSE